jgi:uncharacterized protein (TIGR02466 family)
MLEIKRDNYFITPVYYGFDNSYVKDLIKITDPYIKKARKKNEKIIKETNDFGLSHHSTSLITNEDTKNFQRMIYNIANDILDKEQGYDLKDYQLFITELWVQEFSKNGGGHHTPHTHWNGHISGFYFLKASNVTSMPSFYDPRPAKIINDLPMKDPMAVNDAQSIITYPVKPGTIIFFPSYLTHGFSVDPGKEPFRFIHWNIQAINKGAVTYESK